MDYYSPTWGKTTRFGRGWGSSLCRGGVYKMKQIHSHLTSIFITKHILYIFQKNADKFTYSTMAWSTKNTVMAQKHHFLFTIPRYINM